METILENIYLFNILPLQQLQECLDESGHAWKLNPGDGAFYGPKIDIQVSGPAFSECSIDLSELILPLAS